jgi:endonuclease YncB( thermonuclease family)
MAQRDERHHRSADDVPPVGRPRGATWRSLQADGVVWEGQVVLVGGGVDLAARMIVTHRRVAFVRGGDIVLEVPRSWLRQEPVLRRDGVLVLFVAPPASGAFEEPETVLLRMREGHPAAGHIIAMLAPGGVRRIAPDALSGMERAREATPPPTFGGFWDDEALPPASARHAASGDEAGESDEWAPIEPADRVLRLPSAPPSRGTPNQGQSPNLSHYPITGLKPRDQRRSPWGLLLRLGALGLLLGTAAALGAGKLDLIIPHAGGEVVLAPPTATVPASPTEPPLNARLSPGGETALPIGVGGPDAQSTADAGAATATTATPASTPAAASVGTPAAVTAPATPPSPTPAATPTPAPAPTVSATTQAVPAAPSAATPSQTAAQAAAVAADRPPAQELVVGSLRLTVTTALRGESLPKYGLPPGSGEWVLLLADLSNDGDAASSLAMSDFRLLDRSTGNVVNIDTGVDVVAKLAGLDPAWSAADTIEVVPTGSARALLRFLLPQGASDDLSLIVGPLAMDLAPSLALGTAERAGAPTLVQATVAEVLDAARITVNLDGQRTVVQYLGMAAPAAGACFAAEATAANSQLVNGQTVWLERQASDRAGDALLRDVWVADPSGNLALVAARLLEAGAGTPTPAPPDTRYQGWLAGSAETAQANSAGLWGACPQSTPATA